MFVKEDGRIWSVVKINGVPIEMLWDTGASITVMHKNVWEKCKKFRLERSNLTLSGAFNSTPVKCLGKATVEIEHEGQKRNVSIVVVDGISPEFIGGVDIMRTFKIQLQRIQTIDSDALDSDYSDDDRVKKASETFHTNPNDKLCHLLRKYASIFMAGKFDLGKCTLVKHSIKTSGQPIMVPPRRQPMHMEKKIEDVIESLLRANIIKECSSPWNSPMVVVGKKDGSTRICQDFRQLNEITEKYTFPMPEPQTLFDLLGGCRIFSSLDIGHAYYQVELEEEDKIKTAFSTKYGQYCYNRMPFGLSTAPATFQKLMHTMLKGILHKGVVAYIDDILIYARNKDEHDRILEEVFSRIKHSGLRINPAKCKLYQEKLSFLGHIVSSKGLEVMPEKVKEIRDMEIPKCTKSLRSFLGLANYYRKFVENFSLIAKPLYEATEGHRKDISWTDDCMKSFTQLKNALCQAPILSFPNASDTFVLDTDACFSGIGSVLSQIQNGREVVIAYGSRLLRAHERGYCVTRKELLAIYEYVKHFRHYLYGQKFIVRTDHRSLKFMKSSRKPITPQFQTWINELSEYDFDLKYRQGKDHANADGLSRILSSYCSQCQTEHENAKSEKTKVRYLNVLLGEASEARSWPEKFKTNQFLVEIKNFLLGEINELSKDVKESPYFRFMDKFCIVDNLVIAEMDGHKKIVVPKESVDEFITGIHQDLCHIGMKKSTKYISTHFFWPNMVTDIQNNIRKCEYCLRRKVCSGKTKQKLIPRQSTFPMEDIVIDVACMDSRGTHNKYMIVIVDHYSKMVSLTATPRQNESTIKNVLLHKWIYRFGQPKTVVSDCGKVFESSEIQDLAKSMDIKWIFSSPYDHQSNGLAERTIRTARDMIVTSLKTGGREKRWDEILPRVEFSINCSIQKSTGYSPMEIVFGRKINIHSPFVENRENSTKEVVTRNLKRAAEKLSQFEKDKRVERKFNIGQKVLVKKEPNKRKKDDFLYEGPYEILKFQTPHQVVLKTPGGTKNRRIEWLKRI